MPGPDPNRRKFLKHLGLIGLGGVAGLGIAHFTSRNSKSFVDEYSKERVKTLKKRIFATKADFDNPENRTDYEGYLDEYRQTSGEEMDLKVGGVPYINEVVCAFDIPVTEDDGSAGNLRGVHCTHPCIDVCPVDALSLRTWDMNDLDPDTNKKFPGFKKDGDIDQNVGNNTNCIGCAKCFKICGYDAIQWINNWEGGGV